MNKYELILISKNPRDINDKNMRPVKRLLQVTSWVEQD
jgi:hypothetical protein